MKKLSLIGIGLVWATSVSAYYSGAINPNNPGEHEVEYKTVVKTTVEGLSQAVVRGDVLSLDTAYHNDGYTVTKVGANTAASANRIACIAYKAIATGNTASSCVTRGFVDYLRYDATVPIAEGSKLCANSAGRAVVCTGCSETAYLNAVCANSSASANSPIVSLEQKPSGTGTMKALILSR